MTIVEASYIAISQIVQEICQISKIEIGIKGLSEFIHAVYVNLLIFYITCYIQSFLFNYYNNLLDKKYNEPNMKGDHLKRGTSKILSNFGY